MTKIRLFFIAVGTWLIAGYFLGGVVIDSILLSGSSLLSGFIGAGLFLIGLILELINGNNEESKKIIPTFYFTIFIILVLNIFYFTGYLHSNFVFIIVINLLLAFYLIVLLLKFKKM